MKLSEAFSLSECQCENDFLNGVKATFGRFIDALNLRFKWYSMLLLWKETKDE